MKQFTVILILLVFSISEFKPLIHLADYAINYDYIATELCIEKDEPESCCKGKCYLNDQLAKTVNEQEDDSSERRAPKIEWEKIPMIVFPSEKIGFASIEEERPAPSTSRNIRFEDISLNIPTPPPRS